MSDSKQPNYDSATAHLDSKILHLDQQLETESDALDLFALNLTSHLSAMIERTRVDLRLGMIMTVEGRRLQRIEEGKANNTDKTSLEKGNILLADIRAFVEELKITSTISYKKVQEKLKIFIAAHPSCACNEDSNISPTLNYEPLVFGKSFQLSISHGAGTVRPLFHLFQRFEKAE